MHTVEVPGPSASEKTCLHGDTPAMPGKPRRCLQRRRKAGARSARAASRQGPWIDNNNKA